MNYRVRQLATSWSFYSDPRINIDVQIVFFFLHFVKIKLLIQYVKYFPYVYLNTTLKKNFMKKMARNGKKVAEPWFNALQK